MQNLSNLTKKDLKQYSKNQLIDIVLMLIKRDEEREKQIQLLQYVESQVKSLEKNFKLLEVQWISLRTGKLFMQSLIL